MRRPGRSALAAAGRSCVEQQAEDEFRDRLEAWFGDHRALRSRPGSLRSQALLISVNRSAAERDLYEATRYAWTINPAKARQADVVLATLQGLIVGAFIATEWLPATAEHFPGREEVPGRWGFVGHEAPDDLRERYVRKRVPDESRKLRCSQSDQVHVVSPGVRGVAVTSTERTTRLPFRRHGSWAPA
jgi:hypothetical protein